jgi:hypothetical protein
MGLIDKVIEYRGKVLAIEHKTTTQYRKGGPFRHTFTEMFSPNSQVDGYQYALHLLYPKRNGGVWVDAALVHRSESGYMFIPVEKQRQMLDAWLWEVSYWIELVKEDRRLLELTRPEHLYMAAFPRKPEACFDYGASCPYLNMCRAWPNPVGREAPDTFRVEHWNPLQRGSTEKVVAPIVLDLLQ